MPIETAPNPDSYVIGRGIVALAELDANGNPKGFRDVGNATEFKVTGTKEEIEHTSSRSSLATIDKRIVLSQGMTCGFTLDEVQNFDNLAAWLIGATSTATNAAVAGFAEWQLVADGDITIGSYYLIRSSAGVRAFSIDAAADLVIKTTNASPVTLVKDTDYSVDELTGTFKILASSAINTAITNGEGLDVTLSSNGAAPATVDKVNALSLQSLTVAVRFVLENAADDGHKTEIVLPKVLLSSSGDLNLIGRDFATMQFEGSVEQGATGSLYAGEYAVITDPNGS